MPFVHDSTVIKKSVTFKYVPTTGDAEAGELRTWIFERPGSYRDDNDPMKSEEWPVESVTVILEGSPGHWSTKSILVECHLNGKIQTTMINGTKYNMVPWWLVRLVGRAAQ